MSNNSDEEEPEKMRETQNPWGYYYLRYFVGAVIGAGVLLVLLLAAYLHNAFPAKLVNMIHRLSDSRLSESAVLLASVITALGTAGLVYCYIASAPVLILHAFRTRLPRTGHFLTGLGFGIAILTIVLGVIFWFATPECLRNAVYLPFSVVVLGELFLVGCPRVRTVRRFYHQLAGNRAEANERKIAEYIESYRHLREHGNAFLIILMELILAAALYVTVDNSVRFFGIIIIWILPAAIIWPLGTWLEFQFPKKSGGSATTNSAELIRSADP